MTNVTAGAERNLHNTRMDENALRRHAEEKRKEAAHLRDTQKKRIALHESAIASFETKIQGMRREIDHDTRDFEAKAEQCEKDAEQYDQKANTARDEAKKRKQAQAAGIASKIFGGNS